MSRIRSLHPGLFTDDQYMALSFPARELLKGIWCEADDQGVFEWKPRTLKARILPGDNVDVPELLDELIAGRFVTQYDHGGHQYGVVRNFRKFQRPKKPNATHFMPPEFRMYIGLDDGKEEAGETDNQPVPHQFPTEGEKPPQMEDEGRRRKDEGSKKGSAPNGAAQPSGLIDLKAVVFDQGLAWISDKSGKPINKLRPLVGRWCKDHGEAVVVEAIAAAQREGPIDPISWVIAKLTAKPRHQSASGLIPMHPGAGG